jgi:3-dehydroquinate synthase
MKINSNIHNYEVIFQSSLSFFAELAAMPAKVLVMDRSIYNLYPKLSQGIDAYDLVLIDANEENKSLESVQSLLRQLVNRDEKRNLTLISVGGGIVQDITGYAAATLYRGINWIFVPTTLLAQADSCVGSKTSINFAGFKNILGGFYPPHQIHLCPEFIHSLPKVDFYSGVGEIIKFLLLDDLKEPDLDEIEGIVHDLYLGKNYQYAIERSLAVKQSYINQDEFDSGKRNLFNYGHCFGHALEVSSNYQVPHGIAVTIGMVYANLVALQRNLISDSFYQQLNQRLLLVNIPLEIKKDWLEQQKLLAALKNDKKRVGKDLTMIILSSDKVEAVKIDDLREDEFSHALTSLNKLLIK